VVSAGCLCLGPYGSMTSHSSHSPEWLVNSDCTFTLRDPKEVAAASVDATGTKAIAQQSLSGSIREHPDSERFDWFAVDLHDDRRAQAFSPRRESGSELQEEPAAITGPDGKTDLALALIKPAEMNDLARRSVGDVTRHFAAAKPVAHLHGVLSVGRE
jgi:hypothetical protein